MACTNSDDDSSALFPTRLSGNAFSYLDSLPYETKSDYTQVKDKLTAVFGKTAYLSTFQSCTHARTRLLGEALTVFAKITDWRRKRLPHMDYLLKMERYLGASLLELSHIFWYDIMNKV